MPHYSRDSTLSERYHAERAEMKIAGRRFPSPIIVRGTPEVAHRDPAIHYHDGVFRVFYGLARLMDPPEQGRVTFQLAVIESTDLIHWSEPRTLTPLDDDLNLTDPGNVVRFRDEWIMTVENYRTPFSPSGGQETTRCWLMRSDDLETWSEPELMLLKGPEVSDAQMERVSAPVCFPTATTPTNGGAPSSRAALPWRRRADWRSAAPTCRAARCCCRA